MLDYLKPLKKESYDCLMFIPGEKPDSLHIEGSKYRESGEKLDGSAMGDCYHILLYKDNEIKGVHNLDLFEGILMDPLEYASRLIPQGWYGMFAKKTTTSDEFINKAFDALKQSVIQ